jgi:hypothetical protein
MVERKNESLIPNSPLEIPIDTGAPLRVFGVVSSLEQDHALLDEMSQKAASPFLKTRVRNMAETLSEELRFYELLGRSVAHNTLLLLPERYAFSNDDHDIPPFSYLCDGIEIKERSPLELIHVLDLIMTPHEVGHLLERDKVVRTMHQGRSIHFVAPFPHAT